MGDLQNDQERCTFSINGVEYDVTNWIPYHPGGPQILLKYNGLDATAAFQAFHSEEAKEKLKRMPTVNKHASTLPTIKNETPSSNPSDEDEKGRSKQKQTPEENDTIEEEGSSESDSDASEKKDKTLIKNLSQNSSTDNENNPDSVMQNFYLLRKEIENTQSLFKTSAFYYTYKTLTTFSIFLLSVYILIYTQQYVLSAFVLGLFYQQAGWLSHEYCHHQVFSNRNYNNILGLFMGNIMQGFSVTWWKDRHNLHHASTNIFDADPDIDNLPIFVWSVHDLPRLNTWAKSEDSLIKKTMKYQAYYFLLFCFTLRLIWCLQSLRFVTAVEEYKSKHYTNKATLEYYLLLVHWIGYFSLVLFFVPGFFSKILYFLISQFVGGFCIAIIVFFNHYACEHIPCHDRETYNFVELQLRTTKNSNPSILMDWFAGGLNYQIEHHLFPTLPRHNLYKVSHLVKDFCKQNNLPYQCCGFFEGIVHIHKQLSHVATFIS